MTIIDCMIFENDIKRSNENFLELYRRRSTLCLRGGQLFRFLHLPFFHNLNPKLKGVDDDTLIVFDGAVYDRYTLKYIAGHTKGKRLIFYYWDPVWRAIDPKFIPAAYEIWSYSYTDCEKYGFLFNPTFFFDNREEEGSHDILYDVYFLGKDKGRKRELAKLEQMLTNIGLRSLFYVTANHPKLQKKGYLPPISYAENLEYVQKSKCLLDFYVDETAGLSLRTMESLFYNKKLITNNKQILRFDFYRKDNIFILGVDEEKELADFIDAPYSPVDASIKEKYLFANWLKRFEEG